MYLIDIDDNGVPSKVRGTSLPQIRTVTGTADEILHPVTGKRIGYKVPQGHGEYSGKMVSQRIFEYAVFNEPLKQTPMKENDYNFANDEDFAMKLKAFYGRDFRRSGRTRLQAQILVDLALETRERIYLSDHAATFLDTRRTDEELMRQIHRVIEEYKASGCNIIVRQANLRDAFIHLEYCGGNFHNLRIRDFRPTSNKEELYYLGDDDFDENELLMCCKL